ncbi:MAG: fibronectin type III domain-containing protein, partial [Epsilonproteobacteria bacterium]|nr:fibronectin type III domain-containing protein [Campylobacterota bacterium]
IEGTDMNVIAANMNDEIQKVTGRKYGIHRGKPPAALIHGSGREYYYSKGILSLVVEVGTKNIPDYMKVMSGSIKENIAALIKTFSEVINYSPLAPRRVDNFRVFDVGAQSVTLSWDYELREDIYFEIYRSTLDKDACNERTLVGITTKNYYIDDQLESSTNYNYTIRAVNKKSTLKSPFAPVVKARTKLDDDEFFKFIFASQKETGYVGEYTQERNRSHFGVNSLFVGVNKSKGVCDGVVTFDLSTLPKNAIIKRARFYIYPMNRVGAKIEKFGEWSLSLLEPNSFSDISDFNQIDKAPAKTLIGQAIKSQHLTQGIWNFWDFSQKECELLQEEIKNKKAVFRLDGPKYLPDGEDSQMMQFDIGYGKFGGGIHYRPMLDIVYTLEPEVLELRPQELSTISKDRVKENILESGFDKDGDKVYGYMSFDLSKLPDFETTMITECAIKIKSKNRINKKSDVRFYLELVEVDEVGSYEDIKHREKIEYIGYEVAQSDLKPNEYQFFKFDTLSRKVLDILHQNNKSLKLVIKPTTALGAKNQITQWDEDVKLIVKYVPKRRKALQKVKNLKITKEKGIIKLTWDRVEDENLKGYYVVRNRFHPPKHFLDGVKLYGGKDNFTYDKFGSLDIEKYYAVFAYDNVPNFSEPAIIKYDPLESYESKC